MQGAGIYNETIVFPHLRSSESSEEMTIQF